MAGNVTVRHVGPFDFVVLYGFLKETLENTTHLLSSPYFQAGQNYISITNDVCLNITGSSHDSFAVYGNQGIWNRIVTWKLPLVTLLFQFARPPFAFRLFTNTNVFIIMHLIGNPISTIASLLFTVQVCQSRVHVLRSHILRLQHELSATNNSDLAWRVARNRSSLWKIFGLLCISYDEWKVKSMDLLTASLRILNKPNAPQSWTNIEAYSIAMSAPFLAILPAVFLSAIIGVPQTETSLPRILNAFREKIISEDWPELIERIFLPELTTGKDLRTDSDRFAGAEQDETELTLSERIAIGGIYAWRPEMLSLEKLPHTWPLIAVASSFVFLSVFVAGWILYRVPPEGFDCRNTAQLAL